MVVMERDFACGQSTIQSLYMHGILAWEGHWWLFHAVAAVPFSLSKLKLKKYEIHCKCPHIHSNNKIMTVIDYGAAKNDTSIANNRKFWKYIVFMQFAKEFDRNWLSAH